MPINLRPIAYGTGLTLSTDGALTKSLVPNWEIVIKARPSRDGVRWAICEQVGEGCSVLNRHGKWEWEPRVSERDEAFYARCRYASLDEARAWLEQVMEGQSK